ncbi:MAG: OmpH family outer membrane protein [Prevotella sp.]|nr:OmpH family outer membrane protein [Prevotella sp.]
MRKTTLLILLFILPLIACAQVKFGYLSYSDAISSMPDNSIVKERLGKLKSQYDKEMKRVEDEFNAKYEVFLDEMSTLATPIRNKRQSELQEMMEKNIAFKNEARRLLKQAEEDLYMPLREKLNATLAKIGSERGYAFILNTDNNACPYTDPTMGEDINDTVKQALRGK